MLTRTEGIILKTQKYGEADLIVTCLTPDTGIIKAFAKSSRKTRSRFGSSLEPLTHAGISLWGREQSKMHKITQADIINSFHSLRESYYDFVNISKLAEILISMMPEGIPSRRLFSFFLDILRFMKSSGPQQHREALYLIARIRLLAVIGCAPRLSGCGRCGAKSLDFYPDSGTTLCRRCAGAPDRAGRPFMRIGNRTVRFYAHSIEWPMSLSNRLRPDGRTLSELSGLVDSHLKHLLSGQLRSSGFPEAVSPGNRHAFAGG